MAIVMNAKGTTSPYFKIGKQGTNVFQGSSDPASSYTTAEGDMWIDTSNKITKFRNSGNDGWTQGSLDITGNATISGDLTINGTTTTLDTTNLLIEDPLLVLARNVSGTPAYDAGIVVERGDSTNVGIIWDESADQFAVVNTTETGSTAGNVSIASYANIKADEFHGDGSNLTGVTSAVNDLSDGVTNSSGGTIGIGTGALAADDGSANNGTAFGYNALNDQTTGFTNVGIGYKAAEKITTGGNNVAIGAQTLTTVVGSLGSVAIGAYSGQYANGASNTFVGNEAGQGAVVSGGVTATGNVGVGTTSLGRVTNAEHNVAIGFSAGAYLTSGNWNTFIGPYAADATTTGINQIVIGHNADASAVDVDNEITFGNSSITAVRFPQDGTVFKFGVDGEITLTHVHNSGLQFGGTVIVAEGSAGSPSVALVSNTNTGMYKVGTNRIGFTTGGSHAMGIGSGTDGGDVDIANNLVVTGNVGIGTSSPSHALDVTGSARLLSSSPQLLLQDSDGTNQFTQIIQSGGAVYLDLRNDSSNGQLIVRGKANGSATEFVRIDSSGNVGIGTTSPAATLDVTGTDAVIVAKGTTAERPGTPESGMIRFNTTTSCFEGYNGSSWVNLGAYN